MSMAWSLAHWAVANAKEFAVVRVDVDGKSWDRKARERVAGCTRRRRPGGHHACRGRVLNPEALAAGPDPRLDEDFHYRLHVAAEHLGLLTAARGS